MLTFGLFYPSVTKTQAENFYNEEITIADEIEGGGVYDTLVDSQSNPNLQNHAYGTISNEETDGLMGNMDNSDQPRFRSGILGLIESKMDTVVLWISHTLRIPGKEFKPTLESGRSAYRIAGTLSFAIFVFNWYTLMWGSYFTETVIHKVLVGAQLAWIFLLFLRLLQLPKSQEKLSYQAPFVPLLPVAAVWFNSYVSRKDNFRVLVT